MVPKNLSLSFKWQHSSDSIVRLKRTNTASDGFGAGENVFEQELDVAVEQHDAARSDAGHLDAPTGA